MKKTCKSLLAAVCALSMLLSAQGIWVFADEYQEELIVDEEVIESEDLKASENPNSSGEVESLVNNNDELEVAEELVGESVTGDNMYSRDEGEIEAFEDLENNGTYTTNADSEVDITEGKASGTCGQEAKWHLSDDGTLTIYGKGEMNWDGSNAPWSSYRLDIKKVNVLSGITNIANRAFYECYSLKNATIPDTVTVIGSNAFFGCIGLIDVYLDENITEIKANAFSNCTSLREISLPSNLTTLEQGAFYKCTSLRSVTIPGSVSKIGNSAFDSCSVMNKVVVSEGVTEIEFAAFYKCSNLDSVTLPASIKWMGPSVFWGCSKLKTAGPNGSDANIEYGWTTEFPKEAFYGCDGLEEIELPASLISIPESAFATCSSLKSIIIPQSVVSVGKYAFQQCGALTNISFSENVKSIGTSAFANCTGLTAITLPNTSISFGDKTFAGCTGIKAITIPDNMKSLGSQMFEGCSGLENVQLSEQITSLPYALFNDCTNLKSIEISGSVTSLNSKVFAGCSNLVAVSIPLSVTTIGKDAYAGCEKLADVHYSGVQKLWENINISEGNDYLLNANIYYEPCKDIRNCDISLSETQFIYDGEEKEPAVTVKFQGKMIKKGTDYSVTYENNKNAGTAKLVIEGTGVYTGIAERSFTITRAPQTVFAEPLTYELPVNEATPITKTGFGYVEYISSDESIATIDRSFGGMVVGHKKGTVTINVSFSGGTNYMPASTSFTMNIVDVYEVDSDLCGEEAIWTYYNNGVVRITGKGQVTLVRRQSGGYNWNKYNEIDFYFPQNESNYKTVNLVIIEDGITSIDEYTFAVRDTSGRGYMSDSPEEVIISDTVESIGNYAFYRCDKLKDIEFGSGLSNLGNYVLTYCTALEHIKVSENNDYFKTVDGILYNKEMTTLYKVPANCGIKSYEVPEGVVTLKKDSIGDVKTLTKINIPSSVKVVEDYAFDGCTGLTDVYYAGSKSQWSAINIGSSNLPFTNATIHFAVEEIDLSKCTIKLSETTYTYNGSARKPKVTVQNGSTTLTAGKDYTVSYTDNTNAGTATVKVEGSGKYIGELSVTFIIEKAMPKLTFASNSVNKTTLDAAFTNKLTKTTDGTVSFKSSNTKVATVSSTSGKVTIKGEGTATITATSAEGMNYKSGSAKYTLTVVDGRTDVSELTISLSETCYIYDGKVKEPTVTVKNGSTTLTVGTDYTVGYADNTNAGTATVKVEGAGNYKGERSVTFTIAKADPKLTFASSNVNKTTLDAAFTNKLTKSTDGAVTFKSSNTKVATISSTSGKVTIRGEGSVAITATASEGKNYKAGSAKYTLNVEAPVPTPTPKPTATPIPTPKPTATPKPTVSGFSDVQDPTHAFYNAIYWAADAGITKGYPDGTFGIDRSCTRGEMIMFLWRYAGKPAAKAVTKSPFSDVPKTHSFYNAILWGSQKGITKGYPDGTFGINRNVSRGECMMFLWRLRGKPAPKAVSVSPFKDVPKTHAFYNAILWGAQKKITNGYTSGPKKGTFGINENCTRGAIVTFLYRAR